MAAKQSAFKQTLTDYWHQYCIGKDASGIPHCSMCGNCGIIDSRGVTTAAHLGVGRLNWCICPNGQALREQTKQTFPIASQYDKYNRKIDGSIAEGLRSL